MGESQTTENYCSHCGSALEPDDNYCQQCGTQVRPTTPATNVRDSTDELLTFRRRVQDYLANGWSLEHDDGDSVVLADRQFGGMLQHAILLLFTGGIGNLIYIWYKYSHDADRIVLRADESAQTASSVSDTEIPDQELSSAGSIGQYVLGALLLMAGVSALLAFEPMGLVFGFLCLTGAAWSFPPIRRRLQNRYPVTTFGHAHSTDVTTVNDPETLCVLCGSPVETGVERSYHEEYVVAGVPLFTTESGENCYCQNCAGADVADTGVTASTTHDTDPLLEDEEH